MRLPPIPVLTVMYIIFLEPFPAPNRYSPSPAAFASFSRYTGTSSIPWSIWTMGTFCHMRFGAKIIMPAPWLTGPGLPMPMDLTSTMVAPAEATASLMLSTMSLTTASWPRSGQVGLITFEIIEPSKFAAAVAILVPPRSTPTTSDLSIVEPRPLSSLRLL